MVVLISLAIRILSRHNHYSQLPFVSIIIIHILSTWSSFAIIFCKIHHYSQLPFLNLVIIKNHLSYSLLSFVIIPTYKVPKAQLSNLSATADQLGLKDLQAAVEKCFNKSHSSQIIDFGESETDDKQQEHENTVALIDLDQDEDQNFEAVDGKLVETKFSHNLLQRDEEIMKSFEEEEDKSTYKDST